MIRKWFKPSKLSKNNELKQFAEYSSLGFQLLFSIILGYFLGGWIDKKVPENLAFFKVALSLAALLFSLIWIIWKLLNPKD